MARQRSNQLNYVPTLQKIRKVPKTLAGEAFLPVFLGTAQGVTRFRAAPNRLNLLALRQIRKARRLGVGPASENLSAFESLLPSNVPQYDLLLHWVYRAV